MAPVIVVCSASSGQSRAQAFDVRKQVCRRIRMIREIGEPMPASRDDPRRACSAELRQMSKTALIRMCKTGVAVPGGGSRIIEGAYPLSSWRKEELVTEILRAEFPPGPAED